LLGRLLTTWAIPSTLFDLVTFWARGAHLCSCQPGLLCSYLFFLLSWGDRCATTPSFHCLIWGLMNFLPRLGWNHILQILSLLSNWEWAIMPGLKFDSLGSKRNRRHWHLYLCTGLVNGQPAPGDRICRQP
jgi:hypothetical protein